MAINREFSLGVFIGRFQPFHLGHQQVVEDALKIVDKVMFIIGSADAYPSIKNPFTVGQRMDMIKSIYPDAIFETVNDYFYSDEKWATEVINKVNQVEHRDSKICLIGSYKDASSYYLTLLPWHKQLTRSGVIDATNIRQTMFSMASGSIDLKPYLSESVHSWIKQNFWSKELHQDLIEEYSNIAAYREAWSRSPYPPTLVTVDALVTCRNHILLVRRKFAPGKGALALPGGFLREKEFLLDAVIRELKEETHIETSKGILMKFIKCTHCFDHPERSLRGRVITHAFHFDLDQEHLPRVHGDDDADKAMWISISSMLENRSRFYEDHLSIISHFIFKGDYNVASAL